MSLEFTKLRWKRIASCVAGVVCLLGMLVFGVREMYDCRYRTRHVVDSAIHTLMQPACTDPVVAMATLHHSRPMCEQAERDMCTNVWLECSAASLVASLTFFAPLVRLLSSLAVCVSLLAVMVVCVILSVIYRAARNHLMWELPTSKKAM